MNNLLQVMEQKGTPTLKAVALSIGVPPARLYSVAKQPREGQVYDAKAYNWDAIERFIERRLSPEDSLATFEDVIDRAIITDEQLKEMDGRHRGGRARIETIEVDGVSIPVRKYPNFEMGAAPFVCIRGDDLVYKFVHQTVSHTVLVPVDSREGDVSSQSVKVMSNVMMNAKCVGPANIDEEINRRFEDREV